ncbi:MAG TPA: TerC/Alx family metal homeostasis membrane protein [Acidimicrobiales bacterium]|nr:TerC/Alx family metal homeostasis membrane protein [Acidimicrobiales bacterium]
MVPLWSWFAVVGLIVVLLAVDLAGNRAGTPPTLRRALIASAGWITVSVAFGVVLGAVQGGASAEQYFSAYPLEKALSIDNIFVFVLLFRAFGVPAGYQHRVLYFGVVGALVLRAGFISAGAALLDNFSWVLYVFGAVLVLGGARMLRGDGPVDPDRNVVVRLVRHVVPVTDGFRDEHFVVRERGRWSATPLLVALVAIEVTDIVFATDSIPAVFGVTRDVFIVFTSNAFAVLGLRALYFVFADAMDRFEYLKYGLAVLLVLIGVKMLITPLVHLSVAVTLVTIVVVIGAAVGVSLWRSRRPGTASAEP